MRDLRFGVLLVVALSMALPFAHLMEMPARLQWDAALWIETTVTGNVFRMFGTLGGAIEVAAVLAAVALALTLRMRGEDSGLAALGALLLVAAHAVFWVLVAPVNAEFAHWTPASYPSDWQAWRAQWEYSHALRALLEIGAFAALLGSSLHAVETPARRAAVPHRELAARG